MDNVRRLRRLIDEPSESNYTDEELQGYIDVYSGNIYRAAAEVWMEKASGLAPTGIQSYSVGTESYSFAKEKEYNHAMSMYKFYLNKGSRTVIAKARPSNSAGEHHTGIPDRSRLEGDYTGW